jgi:radical SAM superfamily enzyme YgiQ (UPF0313 family)
MKVLLVYPEFPDTFWSFKHALCFENKRSAFPPLGLLTVAAMLPPSWERRLLDTNVQPLRKPEIEWADIIFVSGMLIQQPSMERIVRRCKAMGKRVVVGGPYVSTSPDAFPEADHIFVGEAEETLPQFVAHLADGSAQRVYEADERPDLTTAPVPEFHLAKARHYLAMPLQYSRGCPFRCEFCDIIEIYGRVPRTKSNEQMLAELDALNHTGWRGMVFIVDDNFIGNKRNVRGFLPHLTKWSEQHGWPFSYSTEASLNLADDKELLADMQRAGFRRVFLGIETPDEASLKEAQKGQNTKRDLLAGVRKIQSYGMEVMGGFIIGFDNDPPDIFEKQIDFVTNSAIPMAMIGMLTALPDTQLWRRLEKEGRLLATSSGNNTDGSLNFVPKMDARRLIEGYRQVLGTVYSPDAYYKRSLEVLARTGPGRPEPVGGGFFKIAATLLRTVFSLGLRDRERGSFWKFIGKVLSRHNKQVPQALILASMGYHFRKLTENLLSQEAVVPAALDEAASALGNKQVRIDPPQVLLPLGTEALARTAKSA